MMWRARSFPLLALALAALGGCGETRDLVDDMGIDLSVGLQNGETCGASTDCASTHCVDGVCCESACTGVCEACNLTGQKGTCAPVPAMTDPAMECMPKPIEMADGGADDGGTQLNLPDAGLTTMETPCAPKCDGNRACAFPGEAVSCGDTFCNDKNDVGDSVCDGAGHCGIVVKPCVAYTCGPNACKTSCTSDADCQDGFFCNGSGMCQMKKALGISCGTNPNECQSGFCADGVCCNADCGAITGGQCNLSGSVGTCKCNVNTKICNGTCEWYYPDTDGDTYGAKTGTRIVGCTGDAANPSPAGYVTDHTDCGDDDGRVHPGQGMRSDSNWTSSWSPQFDWNCDGVVTLQYPYRPGAACRFCNPSGGSRFTGGTCGGSQTTCLFNNQRQFFDCPESHCTSSCGLLACICTSWCCGQGCQTSSGFLYTLDDAAYIGAYNGCGKSSTLTICGTCGTAGTGTETGTGPTTFSQVQSCQ